MLQIENGFDSYKTAEIMIEKLDKVDVDMNMERMQIDHKINIVVAFSHFISFSFSFNLLACNMCTNCKLVFFSPQWWCCKYSVILHGPEFA